MTEPRLMTDPVAIKRFIMAGNATITLRSAVTGARYTYKIETAPMRSQNSWSKNSYFVKLLTGPDDYSYMGFMAERYGRYVLNASAKSCCNEKSTPFKAFEFMLRMLPTVGCPSGVQVPSLEVRHEGKCGRCGRPLTVPESIDRGIGPDCWQTMGLSDQGVLHV